MLERRVKKGREREEEMGNEVKWVRMGGKERG